MRSLDFSFDQIIPAAQYSYSRRSLKQKWVSVIFLGLKDGRHTRLTTSPSSVSRFYGICVNLNVSHSYEPSRPFTGIASPFNIGFALSYFHLIMCKIVLTNSKYPRNAIVLNVVYKCIYVQVTVGRILIIFGIFGCYPSYFAVQWTGTFLCFMCQMDLVLVRYPVTSNGLRATISSLRRINNQG
jgi:hypothetical protein